LILALKFYMFFCIVLFGIYIVRHFVFTGNRLLGKQKISYGDILTSELPTVSVLVPMHNEEKVAEKLLNRLVKVNYPKDKYEIVVINDHSTDKTGEIIETFKKENPEISIKVMHRTTGNRGKPVALNDGLKIASGEIVVVFDADYLPSKDLIRNLVVNFKNPKVGAVMGRVIPVNSGKNILTKLLELERIGGYQVDQQARYNLHLIPQYGGTVGGFRKNLVVKTGGFKENILAEDTELTFRLYVNGYEVVYSNRAECYEESPEDWSVRGRQIRRWSTGHNQVMFSYIFKLLTSKHLSFFQKVDGILLLMVYLVPVFLFLGILDAVALFFLGEANILTYSYFWVISMMIGTFGNFAPFYQVVAGAILDDSPAKAKLLPLLFFNFFFNTFYILLGFKDALIGLVKKHYPIWDKTQRYGDT